MILAGLFMYSYKFIRRGRSGRGNCPKFPLKCHVKCETGLTAAIILTLSFHQVMAPYYMRIQVCMGALMRDIKIVRRLEQRLCEKLVSMLELIVPS